MTWAAIQPIWPVMLVICYLMAYSMMRVLSQSLYNAVFLHDRVCDARRIRSKYFEDLENDNF